jgi:hypothetical protein
LAVTRAFALARETKHFFLAALSNGLFDLAGGAQLVPALMIASFLTLALTALNGHFRML